MPITFEEAKNEMIAVHSDIDIYWNNWDSNLYNEKKEFNMGMLPMFLGDKREDIKESLGENIEAYYTLLDKMARITFETDPQLMVVTPDPVHPDFEETNPLFNSCNTIDSILSKQSDSRAAHILLQYTPIEGLITLTAKDEKNEHTILSLAVKKRLKKTVILEMIDKIYNAANKGEITKELAIEIFSSTTKIMEVVENFRNYYHPDASISLDEIRDIYKILNKKISALKPSLFSSFVSIFARSSNKPTPLPAPKASEVSALSA